MSSLMHFRYLKQTDVSTMAHSMNVSIIARLIGVWAGLDTEKLE